jgi:energy-coupling factor transport system permease protein
MSNFEYLDRISFGQYLPSGSSIHKLNPGVKLAGLSVLILAVTLTKSMAGLAAGLLFILLLLAISKIPIKHALHGLLSPMPFILVIAIIQLFYISYQSNETAFFIWKFLTINPSGIRSAFLVILRFSILVLLLTETSGVLSSLELVYGLNILLSPLSLLGINTGSAAMIVQIMLRFIPTLTLNAEKIAKSQASRGADWDNPRGKLFQRVKQVFPLLIPLISLSLHQADTLANAMLARAYGASKKRSGLFEYQISWEDVIFLFAILGMIYLIGFWPFG